MTNPAAESLLGDNINGTLKKCIVSRGVGWAMPTAFVYGSKTIDNEAKGLFDHHDRGLEMVLPSGQINGSGN